MLKREVFLKGAVWGLLVCFGAFIAFRMMWARRPIPPTPVPSALDDQPFPPGSEPQPGIPIRDQGGSSKGDGSKDASENPPAPPLPPGTELNRLALSPRSSDRQKAAGLFQMAMDDKSGEIWKSLDRFPVIAWSRLRGREVTGALNKALIEHFSKNRDKVSVHQALFRALKDPQDPETAAVVQLQVKKDLAEPLSQDGLAKHGGLIWVAASVQEEDHAQALAWTRELRWDTRPAETRQDILKLLESTLSFYLDASIGKVDGAQAVEVFGLKVNFRKAPILDLICAPLAMEGLIRGTRKALENPESNALPPRWMDESARAPEKGDGASLWAWVLDRLKEEGGGEGKFKRLGELAEQYEKIFRREGFAFRFWDGLAEEEQAEGNIERPEKGDCYREALRTAPGDMERLIAMRKLSQWHFQRRYFEQGQQFLRETVDRMENMDNQEEALKILGEFDRQAAGYLAKDALAAKENTRRILDGRLKFFRERLEAAERSKAEETEVKAWREKVEEAEKELRKM